MDSAELAGIHALDAGIDGGVGVEVVGAAGEGHGGAVGTYDLRCGAGVGAAPAAGGQANQLYLAGSDVEGVDVVDRVVGDRGIGVQVAGAAVEGNHHAATALCSVADAKVGDVKAGVVIAAEVARGTRIVGGAGQRDCTRGAVPDVNLVIRNRVASGNIDQIGGNAEECNITAVAANDGITRSRVASCLAGSVGDRGADQRNDPGRTIAQVHVLQPVGGDAVDKVGRAAGEHLVAAVGAHRLAGRRRGSVSSGRTTNFGADQYHMDSAELASIHVLHAGIDSGVGVEVVGAAGEGHCSAVGAHYLRCGGRVGTAPAARGQADQLHLSSGHVVGVNVIDRVVGHGGVGVQVAGAAVKSDHHAATALCGVADAKVGDV